ncbi:SdrD B-like domain-containing protein [Poseidonocella sp. HB161398]|uniref:SdrD B-like domain-containing protein n=1 Tax=Poseidonocella sp. HB161398 TaxID=2320855 RepID=UPI001109F0B6|nr:SdrD B-like domain-containing protein [Poseidonocella sp. HB161398]
MTFHSCFPHSAPKLADFGKGASLRPYDRSALGHGTGGQAPRYEICGGADAGAFSVDARSGRLAFRGEGAAPRHGGEGDPYELVLKIRDGYGLSSLRGVKVDVCGTREAPADAECITLEAEDFRSCGFRTAASATASGGEIVKLACGAGSLSTSFQGESGRYALSLFAQDETDGVSKLLVYVGGELAGVVRLDGQSDGPGSDHGRFSQIDLGEIGIARGDAIRIEAYGNGGEYVRLDRICLAPVEDEAGCSRTVTIATEDFEGGAQGWSRCTTSYDPDLGRFLGSFGKCDYPSKSFAVPEGAESVTVAFDLLVIDSWDGEHMYVKVEDTIVDLGRFAWWQAAGSRSGEAGGISFALETVTGPAHLTGQDCAAYFKDQVVRVTLQIPAEKICGSEMTLTFGASLDEGRWNESFAIDNLEITAELPCAPAGDAVVGGRYFIDADGDDTEWNAGTGSWEAGVAGATVELLQDGRVVAATTTDGTGTYRFENVVAGAYSVRFEDPESAAGVGYAFAAADQGDDGADSDVVQADGTTAVFNVGKGCTVWNVDAGIADPATAEIGDLVFLDADGDGVYADGVDAGLSGVVVTLYDADGKAVATTVSGASGAYRFAGLAAGSYQVGFGAVAGLALTAASAAAADALDNDSDADAVTGLTDVFDLAIGETETDIDAGYVQLNAAPVAAADAGAGCADSQILVDVLANDSDADGDALSVATIGGQAVSGGTVYLSGSAAVTLADGGSAVLDFEGLAATLTSAGIVFDGAEALLALNYGETAQVTVSYGIEDGEGGSAEGSIALSFAGTADSLEEIAESLPATVTVQVTNAVQEPFARTDIEDSCFDLKITGADGDTRLEGVVFTAAYCLSFEDTAGDGTDFDTAPEWTGNLYVADADLLPAGVFNDGQIGGNGQSAAENLDLVNYILNQDWEGQGYTGWEVQFAVWELTDDVRYALYAKRYPEYGTAAHIDDILEDAYANGEGFVAGAGDLVGLIIDPATSSDENSQPFIVAVEYDSLDCLCLC